MVHLSGLRKRASYDELINYINTDKTKLRYPNRKATFLANSPQLSSLLELDEMDEQDKEIKKAKVAVSLGSAPTRGAGVNAAVQATTGTKDKEAQATTGTKNKEAQAIPETKDYSDYFNTAFDIDMANVVEDRSEHAGRPVDLSMAFSDEEESASSWGGSSRSSSKTSTKASAIPDNWDEDLTPEQKERHDEMLNRYKKLPEDELRNIYEHITFKRAPTRITREDLIQHLLYYGYLSNY
jgi:hypothetical protein